MNGVDNIIINDGQEVSDNFIEEWDLEKYCKNYNGIKRIGFVGIILKRGKTLISFPKHYKLKSKREQLLNEINKLIYIISLNRISHGSFGFEDNNRDEFPIKAYFYVLDYFKKYGLYITSNKYEEYGYEGNIDWNRTINKSNKVIQKEGMIFLPFVIRKVEDVTVFISECMNYVLSDATSFSEFLRFICPYKSLDSVGFNPNFNNYDYVVKELYKIKNKFFKDSEKRLIRGLIEYFQWKSSHSEYVRLVTFKFENYWESMINNYLCSNFQGIKNDKIIWCENTGLNFEKGKKEYAESNFILEKKKKSQEAYNSFRLEFDHLYIDDQIDMIYLFDSKYYNDELSNLNYKQVFYHYYLKQRHPNMKIINGLLLPTSGDYYIKNHIDRSDLDGVKVTEHYINLTTVLD
ncbi:LlaJI family restriction endonuclease, partial [Staphylococcus pseudintermedius]|nr:LlaJI family restriction endonuclease [Staphylococcus pseudintermedius]